METINIDVFVRQLIADKCSALIESEGMLPADHLAVLKRARDEYFSNPTHKNYDYLKRLFGQTKYVDDAIESKDFHRRVMLIGFKLALNKAKCYFNNYRSVLEVAVKRLDGINPDLKCSPRALLQHYNECLEKLDNPRNDEHHLVSFAKEIAAKIFIETIDLYSYTNKSPFTDSTTNSMLATVKPSLLNQPSAAVVKDTVVPNQTAAPSLFQTAIKNRKKHGDKKKLYKIATPLFII
ncbi:ac106 [Sucra jujuba nucleopolyhedrovirus]|uniref:Ac106 n=1 Tax=Sucra jujuba nucleopolyhedrovirus TaxID=1563660 RepID=A0A097P932_9ABAC|nr:ac106 [Sucra jujuba nucleopolyhedrovirus]AIU41336.1 ac106 [Sucra jujuba nucleopolyhedrovirus]